MIKKITCIECPKGCILEVEIDGAKIIEIRGNDCPKGIAYAKAEIENPLRILTSSVQAEGLSLKMIPVRTDRPIPKDKLFEGMEEIKLIRIEKELGVGEVIIKDFLGLGVNLVATRGANLL